MILRPAFTAIQCIHIYSGAHVKTFLFAFKCGLFLIAFFFFVAHIFSIKDMQDFTLPEVLNIFEEAHWTASLIANVPKEVDLLKIEFLGDGLVKVEFNSTGYDASSGFTKMIANYCHCGVSLLEGDGTEHGWQRILVKTSKPSR